MNSWTQVASGYEKNIRGSTEENGEEEEVEILIVHTIASMFSGNLAKYIKQMNCRQV